MKRRLAMVALIALAAAAMGLRAQQNSTQNDDPNTRTVQGVVTDANNKPVSGAVVQLKDMKTLQIRSFYTQADGAYHFAGLSTNVDYQLRAEHSGSASSAKTLSTFDTHKASTINLKLK
ncbi:MAG: carboxypeptidase regulatory-like domain-containing protein [Acidobacteriaceae bacterium]|nr:carboxypeptidase regulatory-like domain-containing protein [Acidobacteriaceae bacterium]